MVNVSKKEIKNKKKILLISASVLILVTMLFCVSKFIYGAYTPLYDAHVELVFDNYPDPSLKLSEVTAKATIKYYDVETYKYLDTHTDETEGIDISYTWYKFDGEVYNEIETAYDTTYFESNTTYKVVPKIINTTSYYEGVDVSNATIEFKNPRLVFRYDNINYYYEWDNRHTALNDEVSFYVKDLFDKAYYIDLDNTNITIDIDQLYSEIELHHIALSGPSNSINYNSLIELPSGLDVELKSPGSDSLTNVKGYYMDSTGSYYPNSDDIPDDASHTGLYNISLEIKPKNSNYAFTYPDTITINEKKKGEIVNERVLTTDTSNFYYSKQDNGISYEQSTIKINYMYDTKERVFICFNPIKDLGESRFGYGDNYVEVAKNTEIDLPDFPDDGIYYEGYVHSKEQVSPYGNISIDGKFTPYYSMALYMLPVMNMQITQEPTKENSYTVKTNVSEKSPTKPHFIWQKLSNVIKNYYIYNNMESLYKDYMNGTIVTPSLTPFDDYEPNHYVNTINNDGDILSYYFIGNNTININVIAKQSDELLFNIKNCDGTDFDFSQLEDGIIFPPNEESKTVKRAVITQLPESDYKIKIKFSEQENVNGIHLYDDIYLYNLCLASTKEIKMQLPLDTKVYDYKNLNKDYIYSDIKTPSVNMRNMQKSPENIEFIFEAPRLNSEGELSSYHYKYDEGEAEEIYFSLLTDKAKPFSFTIKDKDGNYIDKDDLFFYINCENDYEYRNTNIALNDCILSENETTHVYTFDFEGLQDATVKSQIPEETPLFVDGTKNIYSYFFSVKTKNIEPFTLQLVDPNDMHVYDKTNLMDAMANKTMAYPAINPEGDFYFGPNTIKDNEEVNSVFCYGDYSIDTIIAIDPNDPIEISFENVDNIYDLDISVFPQGEESGLNLGKVCKLINGNTLEFNLMNDEYNALKNGPIDDDNTYLYNFIFYYSKPFKIKFNPINNTTYTYLEDFDDDESNNNVLDINHITDGRYRCEVIGENYDLDFFDSIPVTLYSNEVTYTKENTPGGGGSSGGGSSHKKKDDEKKEEPKVEEPVQVESKNKSYMNGYEDKTFKPNSNVARQEVATILARINELFSDTSSYTSYLNKYNDVRDDDWYSNYLGFISKENILQGYTEETGTSFHPKDNMTRAEFATAVVRMFNLKDDTNKKCNLTDIKGKWYEKNVTTLCNLGLINGYEDNSFRGDQGITRAEVCKIINAATKRYIKDSTTISSEEAKKLNNMFSDISSKDWFYYDVLTATVDFTYKETAK